MAKYIVDSFYLQDFFNGFLGDTETKEKWLGKQSRSYHLIKYVKTVNRRGRCQIPSKPQFWTFNARITEYSSNNVDLKIIGINWRSIKEVESHQTTKQKWR